MKFTNKTLSWLVVGLIAVAAIFMLVFKSEITDKIDTIKTEIQEQQQEEDNGNANPGAQSVRYFVEQMPIYE